MKAKIALGCLAAFLLVLFNVVFFSVWEQMSVSRWICWAAIHAAGALFAAAAHSTKMSDDGLVHSYPKMHVAFAVFSTMVLVGGFVSVWNPASWKIPVVLLSLFAAGDLIAYIALMSAEEQTNAGRKADARQRRFLLAGAERLAAARDGLSDPSRKKLLETAYDAVRAARISGVPDAAGHEAAIEALVTRLCEAARNGGGEDLPETVRELVAAVRKRDSDARLSR